MGHRLDCRDSCDPDDKEKIDLNPNFQRREAWDDKRKSAFIESLICEFPIPQIILAESKAKNGSYIVIDGKQRLLSLRRFFATNDDHEFQPLRLRGLEVLKDLNGKTFEEIKDDPAISSYVDAAENQSIRTTVIKNWPSEEFLYNVFLRLNTGSLPLSTQKFIITLKRDEVIGKIDVLLSFSDEMNRMKVQWELRIDNLLHG